MRQTPLYRAHQALNARFVDFGDWQMPVQYSGVIEEHRRVRESVGLFDVSHMGEIEVRGKEAVATVQNLSANDLARLRPGQAQYSLLCTPRGGIIDDVIVHLISEERVMICVNAGNTEKDLAWIEKNKGSCDIVNRSQELALIAVQGPKASATVSTISDIDFAAIPRFSFVEGNVGGHRVLIAHTGYTGEDGWEIYCDAGDAESLWHKLMESGEKHSILPAGLGARDTLRLEAALPLYGNEFDEESNPFEARLSWVVRLKKGDFIGRDALIEKKERIEKRLVGIALTERGIPRKGHRLVAAGDEIGGITSGTMSPSLGKGIGLGYVAKKYSKVGSKVGVEIRNRVIDGVVVKLPFL